MRVRIVAITLGGLLLTGGVASAQTEDIQKKIEKKLGELKKEEAKKDQASLEELLSLALKSNPDIRVAESKLREAEAELYRARMKVFNRIVTLQQELKGHKAEADTLKKDYERLMKMYTEGAVPEVRLHEAAAALQKAKTELVRAESEMDLLTGKHTEKAAQWMAGLQWLAEKEGNRLHVWDPVAGKEVKPHAAPAPVPGAMADTIRKALDARFRFEYNGELTVEDVLELLRQHAKGLNILAMAGNLNSHPVKLRLTEPIPLGAFFQWAEDQFNWRFIVRDYGIVATDRNAVPPGAVLLLDLWRRGKEPSAAP
jgi:hypothetical protein